MKIAMSGMKTILEKNYTKEVNSLLDTAEDRFVWKICNRNYPKSNRNWKNKGKFHALDSTLGILHIVTHLILVKYQENTIIFLILYKPKCHVIQTQCREKLIHHTILTIHTATVRTYTRWWENV